MKVLNHKNFFRFFSGASYLVSRRKNFHVSDSAGSGPEFDPMSGGKKQKEKGVPLEMKKSAIAFHSFGFGCLCSTVYLQLHVMLSIFQRGYFRGVEANQIILVFEIFMGIFALIYLCSIFKSVLWKFRA